MSAAPILVFGVSQRSGTNYLWRLLRCHRDCAAPSPLLEDYLFARADLLERYVRETSDLWDPAWGDVASARTTLERTIGASIGTFLERLAGGQRPLAKTPSPSNLVLVSRLLPEAEVLVLVRDGRSVMASFVAGFGVDDEHAAHNWRAGAREILHWLDADPARRARIVRYEDLVRDRDRELQRILALVGLSADGLDHAAVRDLPVFGSSFHRGGAGEVHWDPVPATDGFDPIERHAGWSAERTRRFAHLAGDEMRRLGYDIPTVAPTARDRWLDARWRVRAATRRWRTRG